MTHSYWRKLVMSSHVDDRRMAARSTNCPADLLEILAADDDYYVQIAVAANPSSSDAALSICLRHFHLVYGVAANPGASPELLRRIASVAKQRRESTIEVTLMNNPSTPADVVEGLQAVYGTELFKYAGRFTPSLVPKSSPLPKEFNGLQPSEEARRQIALTSSRRNIETIFIEMTAEKDPSIRAFVAVSEDAPTKALDALLHDQAVEVRRYLATNQILSADQLLTLAQDPDTVLKRMLCERGLLPEEVLQILYADPDIAVRLAAIEAWSVESMPYSKRLEEFLASFDVEGRIDLARRKDLPLGLQERLLQDSDVRVVDTLTHNGWIVSEIRDVADRYMVYYEDVVLAPTNTIEVIEMELD